MNQRMELLPSLSQYIMLLQYTNVMKGMILFLMNESERVKSMDCGLEMTESVNVSKQV